MLNVLRGRHYQVRLQRLHVSTRSGQVTSGLESFYRTVVGFVNEEMVGPLTAILVAPSICDRHMRSPGRRTTQLVDDAGFAETLLKVLMPNRGCLITPNRITGRKTQSSVLAPRESGSLLQLLSHNVANW